MENKLLVLLPIGCSLLTPVVAQNQVEHKYNIVYVLLDDLAYDAIESTNRYPFLKTPNITRLQSEGVTFDNFFCTMALSSPSRACMLTGMYPHKHGVTQNDDRVDADWEKYPPYTSYLQSAGYETAFIGKMHQAALWGKDQVRPGFDYWLGFRHQGDYYKNTLNENGKEFYKEGYITDVLTDYAIDWMTKKRDKNKPFSLCLWHKAVHEPYIAAPRHIGCYKEELLHLPPKGNGVETFEGKPEWQKYKKTFYKIGKNDPEWNPEYETPKKILETLLAVDESIGNVLGTLEKIGELDNTVVVFSSDNGYFMGEHGFWDKRISYDECMRIPLIIRFPNKLGAGKHVEEMCLNIDIAPTMIDIAGTDVPDYMQGKSMLPLLSDNREDIDWRKSFLFEYFVDDAYPYAGPTQVAIRTEEYKLVDCFLDDDIDELYDLRKDPGEMINLINNPDYKIIQKQLRKELKDLMKQTEFNPDRDFWLRKQVPVWEKKYKNK